MSLDEKIRYVPEVTPGTTPTDDAGWKDAPMTSETFQISPTFGTDDTIIADGMPRDVPMTDMAFPGTLNGNLVAGFYDDFMAAAMGGTWVTDVLKNGVLVPAFSVEREFADISTDGFIVHAGATVNTMSISANYGSNVTISFEFLCMGASFASVSAVGAGSTVPVTTWTLITAANGVTNVLIGGAALPAGTVARDYNFRITRNLQEKRGLGAPIGPKAQAVRSNFEVTGNLNLYHDNASHGYYKTMTEGTSFDLDVTLTDGAKSFQIDTPALTLQGGGDPSATGPDQRMVDLPFTGRFNGVDTIATITRVP